MDLCEAEALVFPLPMLSDLCAELCPCLKPRWILLHAIYVVFLSCWETVLQPSFPFCIKIKSVLEDSLEDQFRVQF